MKTLFVYEDVTATRVVGELDSPTTPSLLVEARAMLDAVTADARSITGLTVLTCESPDNFDRHAAAADYSLIIAPECGGRLESLARRVLEVGGRLLGPSPEAVRLTADKLELCRHWQRHGVPTPQTWSPVANRVDRRCVVKPRDGAGSQATMLTSGELPDWPNELIAQEYVDGFAASVAVLVGPNRIMPLVPCEQRLSNDGRFEYLGGRLPFEPALAKRAIELATRAVACVPGLAGYVGVDVILGHDGRDWAIEINPRLTTSYVGLRALATFNMVEAMWAAVSGVRTDPLEWNSDPIRFGCDGRLTTS